MPEDRTIEGQPSALPTMLKAALPVLPGVNLIPGVAKKGNALPDLTLHRRNVAVDRDHVAAYAEVCGFEPSQDLPFTYPHMLAFPLHMGIMTDGSFPFPAIGTVHVGNTITRHRPISPSESLDVSATSGQPAPAPQGPGLRPGHHGDRGWARDRVGVDLELPPRRQGRQGREGRGRPVRRRPRHRHRLATARQTSGGSTPRSRATTTRSTSTR